MSERADADVGDVTPAGAEGDELPPVPPLAPRPELPSPATLVPPRLSRPTPPLPSQFAPALPPMPDEEERQRRLDSMKRRATGLLVAMSGVFVVARAFESRHPLLSLLRATAEAGMVGGIADWFAVTALFRHPMGIPIPHTAIIPARKDRVGQSLGNFVQRHFLTRDVIAGKLLTVRIAERLAIWISEPQNARLVARHAARWLANGASMLKDEDVQAWMDRSLEKRVRTMQVAPLLGSMLGLMTQGNRHQELLNEAIKLLARGVEENHDLIRDRIEQESPWWVPGVVDDKIHRKIVTAIENTLRDVRDDPLHPLRLRFDAALRDFVVKLQSSPDVQERAEEIKLEVLNAQAVRRFSSSLWTDVKARLMRYADEPGRHPETIERMLVQLGETLLRDRSLLDKADRAIIEVAVQVVERYQHEVGALIAQTVQSWDTDAMSRRVELAVGRDLQFVRINGTLVGGLVGAILWGISRMFGG
jgi:uncharacterized membrane-anchored protein YjiN (DUF445 family)